MNALAAEQIADDSTDQCSPDGECAGCTLGHYCADKGRTIVCADMVERYGFDTMDRPAAGTACGACALAGHWCPAKGMCGDIPLCLACGAGDVCEQMVAVEKFHCGQAYADFEPEEAPAECRNIVITEADRVAVEQPVESVWSIKDSLDPANLLKPRKVKAIRPNPQKPRSVRAAGSVRVVQKHVKPEEKFKEAAMVKMEMEAAKTTALEMGRSGASINSIATATGWYFGKVKEWLKAADLLKPTTVKEKGPARKPATAQSAAQAEATAAELVKLSVPAERLNDFFLRLPVADKIRIIERELFGG